MATYSSLIDAVGREEGREGRREEGRERERE